MTFLVVYAIKLLKTSNDLPIINRLPKLSTVYKFIF